MEVPEHLRTQLLQIGVLLDHYRNMVTSLEAQQAQLLLIGTGVDITNGGWQLNPDWSLEPSHANDAG